MVSHTASNKFGGTSRHHSRHNNHMPHMLPIRSHGRTRRSHRLFTTRQDRLSCDSTMLKLVRLIPHRRHGRCPEAPDRVRRLQSTINSPPTSTAALPVPIRGAQSDRSRRSTSLRCHTARGTSSVRPQAGWPCRLSRAKDGCKRHRIWLMGLIGRTAVRLTAMTRLYTCVAMGFGKRTPDLRFRRSAPSAISIN